MIRFRIFESERERRPGADEMACIGTPPLTPVRRLWKVRLVRNRRKRNVNGRTERDLPRPFLAGFQRTADLVVGATEDHGWTRDGRHEVLRDRFAPVAGPKEPTEVVRRLAGAGAVPLLQACVHVGPDVVDAIVRSEPVGADVVERVGWKSSGAVTPAVFVDHEAFLHALEHLDDMRRPAYEMSATLRVCYTVVKMSVSSLGDVAR